VVPAVVVKPCPDKNRGHDQAVDHAGGGKIKHDVTLADGRGEIDQNVTGAVPPKKVRPEKYGRTK
jgi:hypothetical protein